MVYLVVMRVCQEEGRRGEVGFFFFFIGKWGKGKGNVRLLAGRRGGEWSFGARIARWEGMAFCVAFEVVRGGSRWFGMRRR